MGSTNNTKTVVSTGKNIRVGFVDIAKFIFSLIVCLYHFYNVIWPNPYFPMGDVSVELFVLISGVFMYSGWERTKEKHALNPSSVQVSPYIYLKRRFMRFLPYVIVGFVLAFSIRIILHINSGEQISFELLYNWLSEHVWEILMINMNGMNDNTPLLNVPAWTLSAMLLAEFVIYALLVNCEKLFTTLICPCTIIIGLGIWRHIPKANHEIWIGYTTFGALRVFILTCLAWFCWQLMKKIRNYSYTSTGKMLLTVFEILMYVGVIWFILNFDTRNYRWLATLMMIFAVAISISGNSNTSRLFSGGKFTSTLGEMSMGIYLVHYPIMRVFRYIWKNTDELFANVWLFILVVFLAAVVFCVAVKYLSKMMAKITDSFRSKCICSEEP